MTDSASKTATSERLLLRIGEIFLRALFATLRVKLEQEENLNERLTAGQPVIMVSWHNRLLTEMSTMSPYRPLVMISQSRDGRRIAELSSRFGYRPVRGSSSRGGARALLQMVRELRSGGVGGHLVDGPRGPVGVIKPGLILMAQRSGAAIVPTYFASARRWCAPSWDRMELPYPFTRVIGRFGPAIDVPRELSDEAAEQLRLDLEKEMEREYALLDARVGGSRIEAPRKASV